MFTSLSPAFWQNLITAGKVVGAVSTFFGVGYAVIRWVSSLLEKKLSGLNNNMHLMMTNHMPHIETSINDFKVGMARVEATVGGMGVRLDEGKEEIRALGTAFTQHLQFHQAASIPVPRNGESAVAPAARPRRNRKKLDPETVSH